MTADRDPACHWLATHRVQVLDAWRRALLARLPAASVPHLQSPDPFGNPIGHRIHAATAAVLDGLVSGVPTPDLAAALEPLLRVQAIQGTAASEAVSLVPLLLSAAREAGGLAGAEAEDLRARLDALLLAAFDVYSRCREDIYEIRVREARRRVATLLDRFSGGAGEPAVMVEPAGPAPR